jgi:hypothetical protein
MDTLKEAINELIERHNEMRIDLIEVNKKLHECMKILNNKIIEFSVEHSEKIKILEKKLQWIGE